MSQNYDQWLSWQKQVIREEYNENSKILNVTTQQQFNATVRESLRHVEKKK